MKSRSLKRVRQGSNRWEEAQFAIRLGNGFASIAIPAGALAQKTYAAVGPSVPPRHPVRNG